MPWFECIGGSGGGTESDFVDLFSDGEWKNSDIINHTLSATGAEWLAIEDGCLIYKDGVTGVSFNIVDTTKRFYLFVEFTATISGGVYCQSGRCVIGADARICQNTGQDRHSWHDIRDVLNTKTYVLNNFLSRSDQGLFFSGNYVSISKIYAKIVDNDTQRIYVD